MVWSERKCGQEEEGTLIYVAGAPEGRSKPGLSQTAVHSLWETLSPGESLLLVLTIRAASRGGTRWDLLSGCIPGHPHLNCRPPP